MPALLGSDTDAGYVSVPDRPGPWPGVVVLHELFGMTDDLRRAADRLAANGYLALAPTFIDEFRLGCLRRALRDQARGTGASWDRIETARQALLDRNDCTGSVGVIGFCFGGGFAMLLAGSGDYDAAAVNYGTAMPAELDDVVAGGCPVVASYGRRDLFLRHAADHVERVLERQHIPHDVKEYPGVGHAFILDHPTNRFLEVTGKFLVGAGYDPAASEDAWRRILRFFGTHLGG